MVSSGDCQYANNDDTNQCNIISIELRWLVIGFQLFDGSRTWENRNKYILNRIGGVEWLISMPIFVHGMVSGILSPIGYPTEVGVSTQKRLWMIATDHLFRVFSLA